MSSNVVNDRPKKNVQITSSEKKSPALNQARKGVSEPCTNHENNVPELSIIVPTYNERDNISHLITRVTRALAGYSWELIIVDDDSPDGTSVKVQQIASKNSRVRCIRRVGRRGLSTAVIEGIMSSSSKFIAVMDGDLQHDETLLPEMLEILKEERANLVIASRYIDGADAKGLENLTRHHKSRVGNWLAHHVLTVSVYDPMSGFFMMPRRLFEDSVYDLSGEGFKILLDFLSSSKADLKIIEYPMHFRQREHGVSKLDLATEVAFLNLLIDKSIGHYIPRRFITFSAVGSFGVLVHLCMLKVLLYSGFVFSVSQTLSGVAAMTTNYMLNNAITYHDQKLTGSSFFSGLISFYLICFIGLIANVGVAQLLFQQDHIWWVSGLAGAAAGAVWNYAVSSTLTWGKFAKKQSLPMEDERGTTST